MRNHMFSQGSNAKRKFLFISILTAFFSLVFSNTAKADDAAYVEFNSETQKLTFKYGEKPGANDETHFYYNLNKSGNDPGWLVHNNDILEVEFESGFENAKPTSCCSWFSGCSKLTKFTNLEYLNTEDVTTMYSMFSSCSVTEISLGNNFNTSKVDDMTYMFYQSKIETLNLGDNFNTSNVKYMRSMFADCYKLKSLDLGNKFNTSNVMDMRHMFDDCNNLVTLNLGNSFNTSKVEYMEYMFNNCFKLTSLDVSGFTTDNVKDMSSMFSWCKKVPTLDVSGFNTLKVEDMNNMFSGDSTLTVLDLSSFNTVNVTNMGAMFDDCSSLTTITFGENFTTDKVKYFSYMFSGDEKLTSIDVSKFDTSNALDFQCMFLNCKKLTSIDVSGFNTGKATSLGGMFYGCSALSSIDLSSFNTGQVTDMGGMFYGCSSLTDLDVSNFVTDNVKGNTEEKKPNRLDAYRFYLDGMSRMFGNCTGLKTLNLCNFSTAEVIDMTEMFSGCSNLLSIIVSSENWNTDKIAISDDMFKGCYSLTGEKGAKLNDFSWWANFDIQYAKKEDLSKLLLILDNYKIIFESTLDGLKGLSSIDAGGVTTTYTYTKNGLEYEVSGNVINYNDYKDGITINSASSGGFDFLCWWGEDISGYTHQTIEIPAETIGNHTYTAVLQYTSSSDVAIVNDNDFRKVMKYEYPLVFQKADINLSTDIYAKGDTINPLGTTELPYKGYFNGNSHTISGISTNASVGATSDVGTLKVAQGGSLLGVLAPESIVENVNIENVLMNIFFRYNGEMYYLNELTLPLLADANAGQIKNCSFSPILNINDYGLNYDTKINLTLVGNNENGEADTENQALLNGIAVFLPNINLLYESYNDMKYTYSCNDLSFDVTYRYWCYLANYLNSQGAVTVPTFESFVAWFESLDASDKTTFKTTIESCDFDTDADESGLTALITALNSWYTDDAQASLRTADETTWNNYLNPQNNGNGNEVAVVATQNLCKSPGKGRIHKVCSAPKGSGNKDGQLSPFDEEYMEFTSAEFASGIAAHWLNYDGRGFTGNYNKMWSQGLLHPIVASSKNGYTVKLNVTTDNDAKSVTVPEYAKVGSKVKMLFTDPLKEVTVGGQPLADDKFFADYALLTIPDTHDGEGIVDISVSFEPTPTKVNTATTSAVRINAHGNTITIRDADCKSVTISDLRGTTIAFAQTLDGAADITVADRGVYVVKCGTTIQKVSIW